MWSSALDVPPHTNTDQHHAGGPTSHWGYKDSQDLNWDQNTISNQKLKYQMRICSFNMGYELSNHTGTTGTTISTGRTLQTESRTSLFWQASTESLIISWFSMFHSSAAGLFRTSLPVWSLTEIQLMCFDKKDTCCMLWNSWFSAFTSELKYSDIILFKKRANCNTLHLCQCWSLTPWHWHNLKLLLWECGFPSTMTAGTWDDTVATDQLMDRIDRMNLWNVSQCCSPTVMNIWSVLYNFSPSFIHTMSGSVTPWTAQPSRTAFPWDTVWLAGCFVNNTPADDTWGLETGHNWQNTDKYC